MGLAFALGLNFAKVATAADSSDSDKVKFRTLKDGLVVAIKEGKIVGGAGASLGKDNIPSFSFYRSGEGAQYKDEAKAILHYLDEHIKPVVESIKNPRGMPSGCERIKMGKKQQNELLTHLSKEKMLVLPYIAEGYRNGSYTTVPDYKHPKQFSRVIYTTGEVTVGDRVFEVTLVSKQRIFDGGYIQYGITRADEKRKKTAEDVSPRFVCYLEQIIVKEKP